MHRSILFSALAVVLFVGCDSNDTPYFGSFEAEVTGPAATSLSGGATFFSSGEPDGPVRVYMHFAGDSPDRKAIGISSFRGVISGTGSFPLANASPETTARLSFIADSNDPDGSYYYARSGTLEITRFTETRLRGTFRAGLETQEGEPVGAIEGEFDAVFQTEGTF